MVTIEGVHNRRGPPNGKREQSRKTTGGQFHVTVISSLNTNMTNLEKSSNGLQTIFEQRLSFYDLRVYDGNFSKTYQSAFNLVLT